MSFTWNIHTFEGRTAIRAALENTASISPVDGSWQIFKVIGKKGIMIGIDAAWGDGWWRHKKKTALTSGRPFQCVWAEAH